MLDSIFRTNGERRQVEADLRDLLVAVREEREAVREDREAAHDDREAARAEREALRTELGKAAGALSKMSRTNKALDDLGAKVESAMRKVDGLTSAAANQEHSARRLEKLELRVGELINQVGEAERSSRALLEPDGHLHKHRRALDDLGAQARDANASLAALRQENDSLAQEHAKLRKSGETLQHAGQGIAALKMDLAELHKTESELRLELRQSRDVAREARVDSEKAVAAAKDAAARFESLAQLHDSSKDMDKRIGALHALVEHVTAKTSVLETQRHAVDHAVSETARLNQMVWAMDAQVVKLSESRDQMQRAEEAVLRIEQLSRSATQDLAHATTARDEFARESARLDGQGRALLQSLRETTERLVVDKEEFGAFDERLRSMSASLADTETRMQTVLERDESLISMQHRAEALGKVFADLRVEIEELAQKQTSLDQLTEQLGLVEALGKRTSAQYDSLMRAQGDLETMRDDLAELQKGYGEAARLRDKVAQDRGALEAFAERTAAMIGRTPEIEVRLESMMGKMALLDEGNESMRRLSEVTADLDEEITRVGGRMQFVQSVEERVKGLFALTTEVERKLAEQVGRRGEIEALASRCDSLGAQVSYAQQQIEGVSALQGRLSPLVAEVSRLGEVLQHSQRSLVSMKGGEAAALEQQTRLAGLIEHGMQQAAETSDRLREVQALSQDLAHVSARSEEVMGQLTQIQAQQRDVLAQVKQTEEHVQRAELMSRQLDHRRTLLVHTEKSLTTFESRIAALDRHSESIDIKMKSLVEREALVQAVKAEVDGIRQISSRSRADLQFVADHRMDVAQLRGTVEDLLSRVGDADDKIALIDRWGKKIDEAQAGAHAVSAIVTDMQGTLESLSEQRVVVDDVGEKLARLDFTVREALSTLTRLDGSAQDAQNTLRMLQREREVAERVEKSIKAVRAGGGGRAGG